MKSFSNLILVLLLFTVSACNFRKDNPTEPTTTDKVKITGKITLNGIPVSGAAISIDDVLNWKTSTDEKGEFEIVGVTKGKHNFLAQKFINDQVVSQKTSISITDNNTELGEIKLPPPPKMFKIDSSGDSKTELKIAWSRVNDSEFKEYKVYRKTDQGIDETTGELAFVGTSKSDTQFVDKNLRTGFTYYYRVYAYSSFGKFSGSNIQQFQIPEINLIKNGDFETSSDGVTPDFWLTRISGQPSFNYFSQSSESVQNGQKSLKIIYIDSLSNPDPGYAAWGGISYTILTSDMVEGIDYTLSLYVKADVGNFQIRLMKNGNFDSPMISYVVPTDSKWTEKKFNFKIDSDTNYLELWISTKPGQAYNGRVKGFIDNIKILK